MAPPRPGDIERYEKDGSLPERLAFGERLQNFKVHPDLVTRLAARMKAKAEGRTIDLAGFPYKTGLPSKGTPRMFVLPIEFPDYPHTQDASRIQSCLFGDGDPDYFPYESMKNYYNRSSYGQLTLQGDVMPWHMASQNRDTYTDSVKPVIKEALDALKDSVDFTQYDNNGDGEIDYFLCYWTGPDTGWNTTFWAWCNISGSHFRSDDYRLDGKSLGVYSWIWEKNDDEGEPEFQAQTSIHETGHGLGLPDYYDYKGGVGPEGGLGGLDMMHSSSYDHNAFSKFLLDWMGAYVVGDSNVIHNLTLRNKDAFPDAVVIMPKSQAALFDEYFVVENRIRSGNDSTLVGTAPLPNEGLVIFHVDARLNDEGTNFYFDNSYTSHKLIRLMEADGQERIETIDGSADAGDFYVEGSSLSRYTTPNSNSYYTATRDGAYVTNISSGWSARTATFVNSSDPLFPNLPGVLDCADLTFTTGGDSLWYGIHRPDATNSNAAQSALLTDGQSCWIRTTANGQGTLTFDWKVSSELNGDTLSCSVDGKTLKSISGETDWQSETFRLSLSVAGDHVILWKYSRNASGIAGENRAWLDNVAWTPISPTLNEALDESVFAWTTSGDNGWYGRTDISAFGGDSARSDVISDGGSAWLKTQATGPGTLNFNWKTLSEANADYLSFILDGSTIEKTSGGTAWLPQSRFIRGDGTHNLAWRYQKNASGSSYADIAMLDRVEFIPTGELQEALDNTILDFTTGPNYQWRYQNYYSTYGGDAAQSSYVTHGGSTSFQATTDGPGSILFHWKVSSEAMHDYLEFRVNDVLQTRISGEQDWIQSGPINVYSPSTLRWTYVKDASGTAGSDTAWVDRVIFTTAFSLGDALDNHYLPLKNHGDVPWIPQSAVSTFGGSALQAGPMPTPPYTVRSSLLQSTLTGPGTLKFYWKISSAYLPFRLLIDGQEAGKIGGKTEWAQYSVALTPGTHSIVWEYRGDGDTFEGAEDKAWLDKVEFLRTISLGEAIDNKSLALTTYSQAGGWFGAEDATAYCGAAAQSSPIQHSQSSFLETTVTGPRNLSFDWKVQSELNKDFLEFYIDDAFKDKISGSTGWATKTYILNAGEHKLSWQYYKDASGSIGADCGWIDKVKLTSTPTLAEALDFTGFVWYTDGNVPWVGQTFTHFHDGDAAQSGDVADSQYSRLYANITGPGLLSFCWKVSSQKGWDFLECNVDGVRRNRISGETDWEQKTYIIESGSHTIEWKYIKDNTFTDSADCGWVDRIQWSPGTVPVCQMNVPYGYPTIQDAINAARQGCVIYVSPGVYRENLVISGKDIVLTSFDPSDPETVRETVIDGGEQGAVITFGGDESPACTVAGLTIIHGLGTKGGGVAGNYTNATLEDCVVTSNTATESGGGVWGFNGTLQRNRISCNRTDFAGGGLHDCSGIVQNNFIHDNRSENYAGGFSWCDGTFRNNTVYGNSAGIQGGGSFAGNSPPINCIFWDNDAPADPEIYYTATPDDDPQNCCIKNWTGAGTGLVTANPLFINPSAGNFHLTKNSPCVDYGKATTGMTDDIDGDPRETYVIPRPRGASHNDIGADEYTTVAPEIDVMTPEGDIPTFLRTFTIQWGVSDVNYESSTDLRLATSRTDAAGPLILSGVKSVSSRMTYLFNCTTAPEGVYYIYGKLSDGFHTPSESWSYGTIRISRVDAEDLSGQLTGASPLPSERLPFADLNNDGEIDVADLVYALGQ